MWFYCVANQSIHRRHNVIFFQTKTILSGHREMNKRVKFEKLLTLNKVLAKVLAKINNMCRTNGHHIVSPSEHRPCLRL